MHTVLQQQQQPLCETQDKVESLLVHGQRVYLGTSTGKISVYLNSASDDSKLEASSDSLSKKPIDQLGVIKELNSLVVLTDGQIILVDLHTLAVQILLKQTKGQANIFAIESSIQSSESTAKGDQGIPIVVTNLAVGCKRRFVLFSWRDSQWQPPKELALPHQIRSLTFPTSNSIILGFSTSTYGRVRVSLGQSKTPLVLEDFVLPSKPSNASQTNASGNSSGGFGLGSLALGLGGIGRVAKNEVLSTGKGELLVLRDSKLISTLPSQF